MSNLTGADALTSSTDVYDYDLAAAAALPANFPWYDQSTSRAMVYLNPDDASKYRGPARGYTLLSAGSITFNTAAGTQRTLTHSAGEGYEVQITEIVAASAVVRVFW